METEAVSETEKISQQNITEPVDVSRGWHDESGFRWRGFERLMIVVLVLTLAGTCFLISAGHGTKQGYKPWSPNSVLRIVTDLINFNFAYPTARGAEVKWLVHGLGTAAALLVGGIGWYICTRREGEGSVSVVDQRSRRSLRSMLSAIFPPSGAMAMLLLFGGWSILSGAWSKWPTASVYAGIHQMMFILWAVVLGLALGRKGVRKSAVVIVVVTVLTALLGIWYHMERSPELRLEFPIGNPLFMATCLIPGILLGLAFLGHGLRGLKGWGRKERASSSGEASEAAKSINISIPWKVVLPLAVAVMVLLWAFKMTDSRGPLLGLIFGLGVGAYLAIRNHHWRTVILVVAILGLALGCWWLRKELSVQERGRGATIRLRLYAWNYVGSMLMDTPLAGQEEKGALGSRMLPLVVGQGQGSYLFHAQQLSRRSAEQDPQAFQGEVLAHAHNQWLEVMAELGAIGLALVATGLGVTIWGGVVTLRREMEPIDRWCLVGLLAALAAIILEETFDVGLRKPGPPMFFYTLVGLTWAMMRSYLPRHAPKRRGCHRVVRGGGLAVVIVVAGVVASIAWNDWEGALAQAKVGEQAGKENWDQALEQAEKAASGRLVPADRLLAMNERMAVAQQAANLRVGQITGMIQRLEGGEVDQNILRLAEEDWEAFQRYGQDCIDTGRRMWQMVPAYPRVAYRVSQCYLMWGQMERAMKGLKMREDARSYVRQAREWLYREYFYNRLNKFLALRMLQVGGNWPLGQRLDILRIPLRVGQADEEFEKVLAGYIGEKKFDQQLGEYLSRAEAIRKQPVKRPWPDAYAPESFRLAALAAKLKGAFERAAELAQHGVELSRYIGHRFPAVVLRGQLERAHYLFLANPADPEESIEICRSVMEAWPEQSTRGAELEPVRQRMWLYMLAGGQEQAVREVLRERVSRLKGQELEQDVEGGLAQLYVRLCKMFGGFPAGQRPTSFEQWLQRATKLAPQWSAAHLLSVRFYLAEGLDARAVRHLEELNRIFSEEPARMQAVLQSLRQRFPENYALQGYIGKWLRSLQTQPAERGS